MNGNKQKIKSAEEYDTINNAGIYCYLLNTTARHKIKKQMSKRRRRESKIDLKEELNNV